jgi:hypothetical protein
MNLIFFNLLTTPVYILTSQKIYIIFFPPVLNCLIQYVGERKKWTVFDSVGDILWLGHL